MWFKSCWFNIHSFLCLQFSLIHIKRGNAYMANPIHIHISPRKPNAQSWTEIDFSRAEKQNRSGVIVRREHKYKYKMNAVEEHWKQIRVNILAYQPISSSHHLFEGGWSCTKSLSTRDKGGKWTWPSNLNHGGALLTGFLTDRCLASRQPRLLQGLNLGSEQKSEPHRHFTVLKWEF